MPDVAEDSNAAGLNKMLQVGSSVNKNGIL